MFMHIIILVTIMQNGTAALLSAASFLTTTAPPPTNFWCDLFFSRLVVVSHSGVKSNILFNLFYRRLDLLFLPIFFWYRKCFTFLKKLQAVVSSTTPLETIIGLICPNHVHVNCKKKTSAGFFNNFDAECVLKRVLKWRLLSCGRRAQRVPLLREKWGYLHA